MNVDRLKFALAACRKVQSENGAEIRFLNLWAQLLEEIAQSLIEQHDPTAALPSPPTSHYRALAEGEVFLPRTGPNTTDSQEAIGAAWDRKEGGRLTPAIRYPDGHVEVVEQELPPTRLLLAAKAMLKKFEADALASPEWEALDDAVRDAGAT